MERSMQERRNVLKEGAFWLSPEIKVPERQLSVKE